MTTATASAAPASPNPSTPPTAGLDARSVLVSACSVRLDLSNPGSQPALFEVRAAAGPDAQLRPYTVPAGKHRSGYFKTADDGSYDLEVFGPDSFYRRLRG